MLTSVCRETEPGKEEVTLSAGGLDSAANTHVDWLLRDVSEGDVVTIKIITGSFDPPQKARKKPEELVLENKLKYFYRLKEELKEHLREE
ncbi:MAG TPA: hypothetical protein VFU15_06340 [Bacteroidia bacterium]|nr:hypothetical protein [Bacteroidia bacterium]